MKKFPPVVIERVIQAAPERVFEAWTDPGLLTKWFKSSEEAEVEAAELDLRIGGSFRIAVRQPNFSYELHGIYLKIEAPKLLEFTWKMTDSPVEPSETLVRVDIQADSGGTRLRITHSNFSNESSSKAHDAGWTSVLANLTLILR